MSKKLYSLSKPLLSSEKSLSFGGLDKGVTVLEYFLKINSENSNFNKTENYII